MKAVLRILLATAAILAGTAAHAHELQTVALRLDESRNDRVSVTLNTPLSRDGQAVAVVPDFGTHCQIIGDSHVERDGDRVLRNWPLICKGGLSGTPLRVAGLDPRTPEALITVNFANGVRQTLTVDRHDPAITLKAEQGERQIVGVGAYLPLGIEHILTGPDHLLFVLGLMLVVATFGGGWRLLLASLTAFTLAHSLTLGLAMFGIWGLPPKPVEILIALSIVLLAVELAEHARRQQQGLRPTLTLRKPWLVAFLFGLLHGFGFAGALSEVGLPDAARGWALFLFNLGVEIGQLVFVATVLLLVNIARKFIPRFNPQSGAITIALGAIAVYWTLDRIDIWLQASRAIPHFGA